MKNIRDLKCNAIRLDLDSNIASQEIAINMISEYQKLWDCSVKDAIVHLLCDYHKLLENSTINTQYISHKSVTPDKFQENKEQLSSAMEKEKIQVNEKTVCSNINDMIKDQDTTFKINPKEVNNKEEGISANDPWAEIIAKNGFKE